MRKLIEQERESNNEEIENIEKMYKKIMQGSESKTMIIKNKLLSLAGHFKVFVASSFNQEQILDSILDAVNSKRIRQYPEKSQERLTLAETRLQRT